MKRPCAAVVLLLTVCLWLIGPGAGASASSVAPDVRSRSPVGLGEFAERGWEWPLAEAHTTDPYRAPAHRFAPGHRGIDLQSAAVVSVRSPAAGIVAFSGQVAGRAILTIDHGDGLVSTLEPIDSALASGTAVTGGSAVGIVGVGGHAAAGTLHWGVRLDGEYINPRLLFGDIPRAVLLPCC